jgi:hypothetical protein
MNVGLYASPAYSAIRELPKSLEELADHHQVIHSAGLRCET